MKNIITVQHTEAVHHTNGMVGSWTDWELTKLGRRQANRIAKNLIPFVKNKDFVMYSSDLLRSKQTAESITKRTDIQPKYDEALRERNLGVAVGKSEAWAHANRTQEKTVDDKPFEGAESQRDIWNRLLPFFNAIRANDEENIIIVSHGGTLGFLNAMWIGLRVEDLGRCALFGQAGGVSFLKRKSSGIHTIQRLSDLSFLYA